MNASDEPLRSELRKSVAVKRNWTHSSREADEKICARDFCAGNHSGSRTRTKAARGESFSVHENLRLLSWVDAVVVCSCELEKASSYIAYLTDDGAGRRSGNEVARAI